MLLFLVFCILGVTFLLMPGVLEALVRQPIENPTWGMRRNQGELHPLGLALSRSTIRRDSLRPDPSPGWRTVLRLHVAEICACDFFTVQALTFRMVHIFFGIAHDRRALLVDLFEIIQIGDHDTDS